MEGVWILNKFLQTQTTSRGIENPAKFPCLRNHRAERAFCLVSFVFNFSALLFIAKFTCQFRRSSHWQKHSPGLLPALSTHYHCLTSVFVLLPNHTGATFYPDISSSEYQTNCSCSNSPYFIIGSATSTSRQTTFYAWDTSVDKRPLPCYKAYILVSCIHSLHRLHPFNEIQFPQLYMNNQIPTWNTA